MSIDNSRISIDWQAVVRAHKDFVCAEPEQELSQGVCMSDGCGSADFYGMDAWRQAARFLGFNRTTIDRTDTAQIDMEACEAERRRVFA